MSYTALFMKYHHMLESRILAAQREISSKKTQLEDNELVKLVSEKLTAVIDPFKEDIQQHCLKNCRVCNTGDINDCDFFYTMMVFGDELILKNFKIKDPLLERHYFGTAQGGDVVLNKMRELAKKYEWTPYDREFARVYYYMLMLGFQEKAKGERQEKRHYAIYGYKNRLSTDGVSEGLSPSIYASIEEAADKSSKLPSVRAAVLWAILTFIALVLVFNGVWYFVTERIQGNLSFISQEVEKLQKSSP